MRVATRAGLLLTVLLPALAGCSSNHVYQGLYEGIRAKEQMQTAPSERLVRPEPPFDYQEYEKLRNERKGVSDRL